MRLKYTTVTQKWSPRSSCPSRRVSFTSGGRGYKPPGDLVDETTWMCRMLWVRTFGLTNVVTDDPCLSVDAVVYRDQLSENLHRLILLLEKKRMPVMKALVHNFSNPGLLVLRFQQRRRACCWTGIGCALDDTRMLVVCRMQCQALRKSTHVAC